MFHRIITFATRLPKSVIAFWLRRSRSRSRRCSAGVGYKVMTDDTAQFLPKGSESAQATAYAQDRFGVQKGTRTVTVLVKRDDGKALTAADRAAGRRARRCRAAFDRSAAVQGQRATPSAPVVAAQAGPVAPDGRFQLVGLQWKAQRHRPGRAGALPPDP